MGPATAGIRGVSKHHENAVSFGARQVLDMLAPSNNPVTNPEIFQQTLQQGGMNFWRGAQNFIEDWNRAMNGKKPVGAEAFGSVTTLPRRRVKSSTATG